MKANLCEEHTTVVAIELVWNILMYNDLQSVGTKHIAFSSAFFQTQSQHRMTPSIYLNS